MGGVSDSRRVSSSGGSSSSLKACWVWFAVKGMELAYWVVILVVWMGLRIEDLEGLVGRLW